MKLIPMLVIKNIALMNRIIISISLIWMFCCSTIMAQEYLKLMNDENADFYDIKKSAGKYFDIKGKSKGSGYKQYKRWEWFMEERVFPSGELSLVNSSLLYNEIRSFRKKYPFSKTAYENWEPVPMKVFDNVDGHWSPGTGRIDRVMVDPLDPSVIYIGAPTGGLWKSTDGGLHWEAKTDDLPSIGICGIAIDFSNTDIIYIATGDGDGGGTYSSGIYKSTDGGDTWTALGLTFPIENNIEGKKLLMHPDNPDILFFTSSIGIYKTTDAGNSWRRVAEGEFDDIEINQGTPNIVYATQNNAFYRSENTGESFTKVPLEISGRIIIGVTKATPSYVYLASGNEGIFFSNDAGQSFEFRGEHPFDKGLKWYMWAFAVSPVDPDILHIGEMESYKSYDGGVTWSEKTTEWLWDNNNVGYTHCDFHEMKYFGDTLYVCTDGGLARSTDDGDTWTLFFDGVETTQIYNIGVCRSDTSKIMFGSQDNGVYYHNNTGWWGWTGGDGMDVIWDYNRPETRYATIQNGQLYCSDHSIAQAGKGGWVTPLAIDPSDPDILYIATDVIRKSTDRMVSWTTIGDFGNNYKKALAVADSDPAYIYASEGGKVWKTINGGDSWTEISNGLPELTVTSIAVHPLKPEIIAVSLSGYTKGEKVYISYNAGFTWSNYSMNLPNIPANTVVFGQHDNNPLYVGMDVGVYYTNDNLALYDDYSTELPDAIVRDLEINYDKGIMYAGTYGRGVWKIKTAAPVILELPGQAKDPFPGNGSVNVNNGVTLSWEPGSQTEGHNVYFGKSDPPVLVSSEQNEMTFTPSELDPATSYYWRIDEVNSLGVTAGPVWSFTTDAYCTASGRAGTTSDYISAVILNDLESLTGKDSYANYTDKHASLVRGMSYELSVTLNYHWELDTVSAWIDWNNDKVFNQNEQILISALDADNNCSGSFTVPGEAETGKLRMRVRSVYNATPVPCGDYFGEVEDYSVVVSGVNSDLPQQAGNPFPLDDALHVPADTVLVWSPGDGSSSHEVFFSEDISSGSTELISVENDTIFDPGTLNRSTTYYWRVDEVNENGRTSGKMWRFTTDSYCPAVSSLNQAGSYISLVQFADVSNSSFFNTYNIYNKFRPEVTGSEELFIKVAVDTPVGDEKVYVWIDWNGNKEFEDTESVNMSELNASFESNGSVIVPADAVQGMTRMRIRMSVEEAGPCNIFRGETEDYQLFILEDPAPPAKALNIMPLNGAENVSTNTTLRWLPGDRTDTHELYFGSENPPPFASALNDSVYLPGPLDENTTYYWRIDEINSGGTIKGDTWVFNTRSSEDMNALKIDFGNYTTPVAEGYAPYRAENKNKSSFHEESYGGLGSDITLDVVFDQGVGDEEVLITDREGNDNTFSPDLLRDWAGFYALSDDLSMTLILKGVPEGSYKWTSYHHDPHDQTGSFYVVVNDASDSTTSEELDISDGSLIISSVSKFISPIESDGSDIELEFVKYGNQGTANNMFVINAFTIDTLLTEGVDDNIANDDINSLELFPNPVKEHLNVIMHPGIQTVRLIITDMEGRIHYSVYHNSPRAVIDVRTFEPGIYNLGMLRNNRFVIRRFIVQ